MKIGLLISSNFPEEYFYNLIEYCNEISGKDEMAESELDFLKKINQKNPQPTWEKAESYCMKGGMIPGNWINFFS